MTVELCAKHSETIAPELMKLYAAARGLWEEECDKWSREFKTQQEREAIEAEERWLACKAELKPKLLSAFDRGDDDNLRDLLFDLICNADRYWRFPPF